MVFEAGISEHFMTRLSDPGAKSRDDHYAASMRRVLGSLRPQVDDAVKV